MTLRTRISAIAISIFALGGIIANAQERPIWGPAVGFPDGTFVQTGIGTVPAGERDLKIINVEVATVASNSPRQGVFRRILRLSDGRAIVYEIALSRSVDHKNFEVRLRSWTPTAAEAHEMEIDPIRLEANFLGKYTDPIIVNDGDLLAVDVLHNPRTNVRLVDYFRIFSDRRLMANKAPNLATAARPLVIEDIKFWIVGFSLRLNAKEVYASKGGVNGRFIWLDIPQTGRFIFSLTPLSEADGFHSEAYLTEQEIVFQHDSDTYVLTSERPIVTASGTFNLWMRVDPTFTFPSRWPSQAGVSFGLGAVDRLPLQHRRE